MTIKLNRKKILFIGIGIIALYLFINRVEFIMGSEFTTGKVVSFYGNRSVSYPVVEFEIVDYIIRFTSEGNMDYYLGDEVPVIYKVNDPVNAEIYSFVGFWLTPIIFMFLPFILLISAVFSFLTKRQYFTVRFGKGIHY